ncbi:MAG: hypothetical protein K8U57_16185 [Planctomycetes bacterium]|nr:hypothetical protein [Planctomycetota bacterium]
MIDTEEEAPDTLALDPATFDRLRTALASGGPAAAADKLIEELRAAEDFQNLFYALLLKKRVELGVSPFPTGPSNELPPETHEPYEQSIREAGRTIGTALLERRKFQQAWTFFRMLGEPEPVRAALEAFEPGPDDDVYPIIEIAWQGGLLPKKGFDLVLERHGVCSAITMVSSSDISSNPELRDYCVSRLIHALHAQLSERLRSDLAGRGGEAPADATVAQLVETYPELLADDAYHIDTSHLSSVVQMSMNLPPGRDLELAQELCAYGRRLSIGLQARNDAPFDDGYEDYVAYFKVIAGAPLPPRVGNLADVEAGLGRFRAKAEREYAEGSTYAAQVYINLLLRVNRPSEALAAAKSFLLAEDERSLICPGVSELAKRAGDYESMAEAAKARNDPVGFLAGLIAGRK